MTEVKTELEEYLEENIDRMEKVSETVTIWCEDKKVMSLIRELNSNIGDIRHIIKTKKN